MQPRPHFFDLEPDELRELFESWGLPGYRAQQVLDWVYRRQVIDLGGMTNLGKVDREMLAERIRFLSGEVVRHQEATDGVQKLLMEWLVDASGSDEPPPLGSGLPLPLLGRDSSVSTQSAEDRSLTVAARSEQTECVMIPTDDRRTACISSQVGCPVGCRFCASGIGGLEGNLTAGRIVEQVWRLASLPRVGRITHVVFMGMGEPLANFEQVTRAVRALTAPWGMGISARRITISTVGLPAQIRRLADLDLPVTLALSLHAPNDELRRNLIPWADYVTVAQLLDACRHYFDKTGREITLEYILLRGVNDRPEHARELAALARTLRSNVNLIRYNEVKGMPFGRPATEDVRQFQAILREAGVNAHIRASRGRDIAAACGQLRHEVATAG